MIIMLMVLFCRDVLLCYDCGATLFFFNPKTRTGRIDMNYSIKNDGLFILLLVELEDYGTEA